MSALKIFSVMIMISITIGWWDVNEGPSRRSQQVSGRFTKCVHNSPCPTFLYCLTLSLQKYSNQIISFLICVTVLSAFSLLQYVERLHQFICLKCIDITFFNGSCLLRCLFVNNYFLVR